MGVMLASKTRSPERVTRGRSTRRGWSPHSPRPGNSSSTTTPAAAARLRPSSAAAARLTSAMRRRASRMTSASPMISMRASRRVGIGSSTPYRNTATAASTAVHAKRNGVGSTEPGTSSPARNSALPIHGNIVARIRIVARLRYRYGDCTACDTRMAMPATSEAYVRVMLIQKPGPRPTSTAAMPSPSSRRSPQNRWCQPSVHASTRRPASDRAHHADDAARNQRVAGDKVEDEPRPRNRHHQHADVLHFQCQHLSRGADGAEFPGVCGAPDGEGDQQHRVPQRAGTRRCRKAYRASGSRIAGATSSGISRGGMFGPTKNEL